MHASEFGIVECHVAKYISEFGIVKCHVTKHNYETICRVFKQITLQSVTT